MLNRPTILVTGATGKQGGAVARLLLASGWPVRALTRDPEKPASRLLTARGAELVKGDLNERASLDAALKGVYGVFSVQDFWEHGHDAEVRQGKLLVDAAKAGGVKHFIYSSVACADERTGLSHFESKQRIEQHLRASGLPFTILRPVWFMENFEIPKARRQIFRGRLVSPLRREKPLQMVAVADIAVFALMALRHPEEYVGQTLEIAGDELTMPQAAEVLSWVIGHSVRYHKTPRWLARFSMSEEILKMYDWLGVRGYHVDIKALHARHPQLLTLEEWALQRGWGQRKG